MLTLRDITVIIPTKKVDELTIVCVKNVSYLFPGVKIIVLPDVNSTGDNEITALKCDIEIFTTGKVTIAAKRNIGVEMSSSYLIGFIDSDAYPDKTWLTKAINVFNSQPLVNVVSGPNVYPPDSSAGQRLIGICELSELITINARYVKKRNSPRMVHSMPACNLIMKKLVFECVGGMNEKLHGGEDFDFCIKIRAINCPIFYDPDILVFHKSRSLKGYFLKRLSYGGFAADNIKNIKSFSVLKTLVPAIFLLSLLLFPFFSNSVIISTLFLLSLFFFVGLIIIETLRLSERLTDLFYIPPLLLLGCLLPGAGTILRLLNIMPSYYKTYKNYE